MDINNETFTNPQVYEERMPTMAILEYSPLEKNLLKSSVVGNSIFIALLCLVLISLTFIFKVEFFQSYHLYFWIGIGLLAVLIMLYALNAFRKKSYAIRERDIVYNEGLFWTSSKVVPFNRVQHCEVGIGPIDRMFGLAELKIFTAGGASSDLTIDGLTPEKANRIKDFIVQKTGIDEEE